ncbi:MAG: DMT family transporter [Bdellovibrionales bacterium]|nr:DMT family transporter [Bdellovibrionales bacterium]
MAQSVMYLLISTTLFSLINVGVKWIDHLPASEIVVFRGSLSLLICYLLIKKKGIPLLGKNRKILFLRGFFGTLALFSLFICLQKIPLAVATTLINLSPILTVVISQIFLKEKAHPIQWGFLLLSFLGVYLARGGVEPVPMEWIVLGFFAALFAGAAYTCVRQLRLSEDPLVVIMYFPLVTIPMISPVMVYEWVTPKNWDWAVLVGIGLLTQVAQYFMTLAYQREKAAKIMVFNYAGLLWAVLWGWLFFHESLEPVQILGITIVLSCLLGNYFVSRKA